MDQMSHILIVDDHREIRDLLAKFLRKHSMRVSTAPDAAEAKKLLKTSAIDLIVLDIMMPGEDGLTFARHVRETDDTPIILLTAMIEDTDRIIGLELGADDYVSKPFNPRELVARIKAVLRRAQSIPVSREPQLNSRLRFGQWTFLPDRREIVSEDEVTTPLSHGECLLLSVFLQRPNMVLNRDQLLDLTKGRMANLFDRSIDNQVSRLRRKIEDDPKTPKLIQTVWGGGYKFAGTVEPL
ncbi:MULTISPECIES: response regulator [Rhodomicrobium]|uniref:response regulator n=1 Tax=Rhodomicrobium TaxID=1068 RepID=UPI000B4B5707|nr:MULTISPECIES: response regulator [Rhodomicrobium]